MNRSELAEALDGVIPATAVNDTKSREALTDLLRHPGLPVLYSLLLGSRQAQLQMLACSPLKDMDTISRAAVIQGTIIGIDLFHDTVLEQSVPSQDEQEHQDG